MAHVGGKAVMEVSGVERETEAEEGANHSIPSGVA